MRFADRITFVNVTESYYDPITGKHVKGEIVKTELPCNQSTLGIQRTNELFGQIDRVITVARLQRPYHGKIDYVYLNEDPAQKDEEKQKYEVKRQSDYRKGVFYLEGVSGGN